MNQSDEEILIFLLTQSFSAQTTEQTQTVANMLGKKSEEWGPQRFCSLLFSLLRLPDSTQIPNLFSLKQSAIITFKRLIIETQWNSEAIPKETKEYCKEQVLQSLLESKNDRIISQVCLSFAKVIQFEYPKNWPTAIQFLLDSMKDTNDLRKRYAGSITLFHVLKNIIKQSDFQNTQQNEDTRNELLKMAEPLFQTTFVTWEYSWQFLYESLKNSKFEYDPIHKSISLYSHKALHLLICFQFVPLSHQVIQNTIEKMMKHCHEISLEGTFEEFEYYINYPSKFAVIAQSKQPEEFRIYIQPIVHFLIFQIENFFPPKKTIINTFHFFHQLLIESVYRIPKKESFFDLKQIFSDDFIQKFSKIIIVKYLVYSEEDLELWDDDPDAFGNEDVSDDWSNKINCAAETLFQTLMLKFPKVCSPIIWQTLQDTLQKEDSKEKLLLKDACFYAISLSYYALSPDISLSQLFEQFLAPELKQNNPSKIMKKRIGQLLEYWSFGLCKETPEFIQNIYFTLNTFLKEDDFAIQLRSACAIREIMDDGNFEIKLFSPFLESCISNLANLAGKSKAEYTTKQILEIVGKVCSHLEDQFEPYANFILELLASMWQTYQNRSEIKLSIVSTLSKIVPSIQEMKKYDEYFINIILSQMDPKNNDSLYLLEEILKLWKKIIEKDNFEFSNNWIQLYLRYLNIFPQTNYDHLSEYVQIAWIYFKRDPSSFIQAFGGAIIEHLSSIFSKKTNHSVSSIVLSLRLYEYLLNENPLQILQNFGSNIFLFLNQLIQNDKGIGNAATQYYISFLGKIYLLEPDWFLGFYKNNGQFPLDEFLDVWLNLCSMIWDWELLKIGCLGLARIFQDPQTQQFFFQDPQKISVLLQILGTGMNQTETDDFEYQIHEKDPFNFPLQDSIAGVLKVIHTSQNLSQNIDYELLSSLQQSLQEE